ncbi:LysR substrate-binding domain-containing protein [Novosphingobium sp.]|uniref:LysR substrate-binding domain-containing protein n=1 Tax=Novosphingobium sp. TaxID=1874826 RepID=UPI003D6D1796
MEFGRDGRDLHARVEGPLILNDVPMILVAAVEGIGLACIMDYQAEALLKAGKLVRIREDWCPPFFGYHLYYPYRGQLPPASRSSSRRFAFKDEASGISDRKVRSGFDQHTPCTSRRVNGR